MSWQTWSFEAAFSGDFFAQCACLSTCSALLGILRKYPNPYGALRIPSAMLGRRSTDSEFEVKSHSLARRAFLRSASAAAGAFVAAHDVLALQAEESAKRNPRAKRDPLIRS